VKTSFRSREIVNRALNGSLAKTVFGLAGLLTVSYLVYLSISGFVLGSLVDPRVLVEPDVLAQATHFFPKSARLHWRLADAELIADDADLTAAEVQARIAVALSPRRFEYRLTQAAVQEALGDRPGAEDSLVTAAALAPRNAAVRWQLANLLFRKGDLPASLEQFTLACSYDRSLLPGMLSLVWGGAATNIGALMASVPKDSASRLLFSRFLAGQGRPVEAAEVFTTVDPAVRRASPETGPFIELLISNGTPALARSVWAETIGVDPGQAPIVWNGGFESAPSARPSRFEWLFRDTKYAQISIGNDGAHSGSRCLKVAFAGLDTTRLDGEITQSIVLNPSTSYRLSFYVKTEGLVTPEGPRITLIVPESNWQAASVPIPAGSSDWRLVSLDFTTPAERANSLPLQKPFPAVATTALTTPNEREQAILVLLSIIRKPAFSYDEPTRGTIWFDDFMVTEAKGQQ
jgi:hypothetical protein